MPARATYGASYCNPRFATNSAPNEATGWPLNVRNSLFHVVPASLNTSIDVRSRNAGQKPSPRCGARNGMRYSREPDTTFSPSRMPDGKPRTANVWREPNVNPGNTATGVPLDPPMSYTPGSTPEAMPPATRAANTWCAKPARFTDLYASNTALRLFDCVGPPLSSHLRRPVAANEIPSSNEMARGGSCVFAQPKDDTMDTYCGSDRKNDMTLSMSGAGSAV